MTAFTRDGLASAFREIGIAPGDSLVVHSSYRSLGEVEGGPATVIEALLDAIGPSGNLMLPTFNYTRPLPVPYYDPCKTPARTGIIPELGRQRPDAVRSMNPTHSVAVIGPDAYELTQDHLAHRTFGIGSPLDRLAQRGGKVLLIGVGNISNSLIHVGEEYAGVPKAYWTDATPVVDIRMPDGTIRTHEVDTSSSCSSAFAGVEGTLRAHGEIADVRIGGSKLQLMRGSDVIGRVRELIAEKPDILLCTWPGCKPCAGARRNLARES